MKRINFNLYPKADISNYLEANIRTYWYVNVTNSLQDNLYGNLYYSLFWKLRNKLERKLMEHLNG